MSSTATATAEAAGGSQQQQQQHGDMNEVIHLNVGGRRYTTTRSTLCRDPDSMLAAMFSGDFTPGHRDNDGNVFIDRDGDVFCHVLNYLRAMKLDLPDSFGDHARLITEAEYFGLRHLLELLRGREKQQSKKRFVELWAMEAAPESLQQFYHPHFTKTTTVLRISGPEGLIRKLELNCACQPLQLTPEMMDSCRVMRVEIPSSDYKLRYVAELNSLGCRLVSHGASVCCEIADGKSVHRQFEQFLFEFTFFDADAAAAAAAAADACAPDACGCSRSLSDLSREKTIPILID